MSVYSVNELVGTPCRKLVKQKSLQSQVEAEVRPPEGLSTQEKPGARFRSRGLCVLVILGTYLCGYFGGASSLAVYQGGFQGRTFNPNSTSDILGKPFLLKYSTLSSKCLNATWSGSLQKPNQYPSINAEGLAKEGRPRRPNLRPSSVCKIFPGSRKEFQG